MSLVAISPETNALKRFRALSVRLLGQNELPVDLAAEYLDRVRAVCPEPGAALFDLLETFGEIVASGGDVDAAIRERIFGDARLRQSARRIIILWYLGELVDDADKSIGGPPEHHFRGLMWEMIHAHPPGLSGGYFGYWKYPPEN